MKTYLAIILAALTCIGASAQTDSLPALRPVTSAYTLRLGSSHLADTYLSPLNFNGWHMAFDYERMQAMKFNPEKWVMQLRFSISADNATATHSNADLWHAGIDFSWAMLHRWRLPFGFTAAVGPAINLDLGCVYNRRNSNNPASAKAAATVAATAYAAWNGKIARLPLTIRYQPSLPITGAFFAPDYGELYYEIYLGNHRNLAHGAWWGNYFQMDNLLTADLHFGATSLRLGYAGNILSTKINHTVTNIFSHAFIIGISGEWLSLNPRKRISPHAKTVSALFQ